MNAISIREFRPFQKNTLQGFLSLELSSGMILHGLTLHEKNGSRWIGMPARPCQRDGTATWTPLVEFNSKQARETFQSAVLAAADVYLSGESKL